MTGRTIIALNRIGMMILASIKRVVFPMVLGGIILIFVSIVSFFIGYSCAPETLCAPVTPCVDSRLEDAAHDVTVPVSPVMQDLLLSWEKSCP